MATITNEQLRLALIKAAKVLIDELETKDKPIQTQVGAAKYHLPVIQYSLEGYLIKRHNSVLDAAIESGTNKYDICYAAGRKVKTAGGFQWRYENDNTPVNIVLPNTYANPIPGKPVLQYENGMFLLAYDSIRQASKKTGINSDSIYKCIKGVQLTAGGYVWKYANT